MKDISVIKGIVIASKWSNDGSVSGLSIHGYDQKEYIVQLNTCGMRLFGCLRKLISATGKISRTIDGRDTIKVSHFDVSELTGDLSEKGC